MFKLVKKFVIALVIAAGLYVVFPDMAQAAVNLPVDWSTVTNINDSTITTANPDNWPQPSYASDQNFLYAAWAEPSGDYTKVRVKKYNGSSWIFIDGGGLNLKGYFTADPSLVIYNGSLYCAYRGQYINGNTTQYGIYIMRYDGVVGGSDQWTRVDDGNRHTAKGESDSGISFSSSAYTSNVFLAEHNGYLYIAWDESHPVLDKTYFQIHVKRYNGSTWEAIDGDTAMGINADYLNNSIAPYISFQGDELYVAWQEMEAIGGSNRYQLIVKKYQYNSGTGKHEWVLTGGSIDGSGVVSGINSSATAVASRPKLLSMNHTLYAVWMESTSMWIRSYNTSAGSWNSAVQLPVSMGIGGRFDIATYNDRLYIIYLYGTSKSVGVMKYDGTTVTNLTDGTNTQINSSAAYTSNTPAIGVYQHTLYTAWVEGTVTSNNIKYRSLILPHITAAASGLTEDTLADASIGITLLGTTFVDTVLDKANFTLTNAPDGLTVESVTNNSGVCTINLAYDGKDFDSDFSLGITVAGNEISSGEVLSDALTLTANKDVEAITITDNDITMGAEDDKVITVTLSGGTFASILSTENWTVTNLPAGVTKGSVTRVDAHTVAIALSGNSSVYYSTDITNVTVACTTDEYEDSTGGTALTANTGVTIKAKTGNISVLQTGTGSVTLNSTVITASYQTAFAMGSSITLSASADPGYQFVFWIDSASGSILSSNENYTFVTGTDTNLTAVFLPVTSGSFHVIFKDPFGKLFDTQTISSGSNAAEPSTLPYIIGYQFIGWDKSLKNITADTVITAQFRRLTTTYHLSLIKGTISGTAAVQGDYKYDTLVTVAADGAEPGKKFAYWTLNGVMVSSSSTYSFYTIMDEMTLTAVYADTSTPAQNPFIALFPTVMLGTDGQSMLVIASRDVLPSGCTLVESGILLYEGGSGFSSELTLNTTGAVIAKVKNSSTNQFFVRKNGITSGETWYARAYMIYRNSATGEMMIIYSSNTVSKAIT